MGAPAGNVNALKNAKKASLRRLTVGELPKPLLSVKREGRAYRRALEAEVLAVKGEVSTTDCHLVDSATAATIHCGIVRWLLRSKISTMSTSDILACSRELVKGKQARDQAVKALGLDAPPSAPWIMDMPSLPSPDGEKSNAK